MTTKGLPIPYRDGRMLEAEVHYLDIALEEGQAPPGHNDIYSGLRDQDSQAAITVNKRLGRLGVRELWTDVTAVSSTFLKTHNTKLSTSEEDQATSITIPQGGRLPSTRIVNKHTEIRLEQGEHIPNV